MATRPYIRSVDHGSYGSFYKLRVPFKSCPWNRSPTMYYLGSRGAIVNIMESRAISLMNRGFFRRAYVKAPINGLIQDPCHLGLPEILTIAHMSYSP